MYTSINSEIILCGTEIFSTKFHRCFFVIIDCFISWKLNVYIQSKFEGYLKSINVSPNDFFLSNYPLKIEISADYALLKKIYICFQLYFYYQTLFIIRKINTNFYINILWTVTYNLKEIVEGHKKLKLAYQKLLSLSLYFRVRVWPTWDQWKHRISLIWPISGSKISSTSKAKVKA